MDLEEAAVDAVVVGDHHGRQLRVAVLDALQGAVERVDDHVDRPERLPFEPQQLGLVLLAHRVAGHGQPNLPVT
jgi:hypothetical protein